MYPAYSQTILIDNKISSYQNYILQARVSTHWKNANFDRFGLVGQGQSKEYCEKWVSYGCDNIKEHPNKLHYAEHMLKSCKSSPCPKCFPTWINRQSHRTSKRLSKFLESRHYKFRHIILSSPISDISYDELKRNLDFSLKVANIKTCAIVFHPWRFNKDKSIPVDSPHFHLLVYGRITNTTEFYNKTKWTIKNKGDLKTDKDIFSCMRYLLSHCGVRKSTHSVRYLGDISYRKLKIEKESHIPHCPYCELPLRIFFIKDSPKSLKPPIDCVGLWEPSNFIPFYPNDDLRKENRIPFYQMNYDGLSYSEHLIYSFEELLHVKMSTPKIFNYKYDRQIKIKTFVFNSYKNISFNNGVTIQYLDMVDRLLDLQGLQKTIPSFCN